jgi:hypothetical protein
MTLKSGFSNRCGLFFTNLAVKTRNVFLNARTTGIFCITFYLFHLLFKMISAALRQVGIANFCISYKKLQAQDFERTPVLGRISKEVIFEKSSCETRRSQPSHPTFRKADIQDCGL